MVKVSTSCTLPPAMYIFLSFFLLFKLLCCFLNIIHRKTLISGGCAIRRWNWCEWMFILYGAIADVGSGTQVSDRNLQCAIGAYLDMCNFAAFSFFPCYYLFISVHLWIKWLFVAFRRGNSFIVFVLADSVIQ